MQERVRTRDIKKTLEELANDLGVPVEELDFEVLSAELVGPEGDRFFLEAEIEVSLKLPGIISIFDCLVDVEEKGVESIAYVKVLPTFRMQLSPEQLEKAEDRIVLTPAQKKELVRETKKLLLKEGVIYGHLPDDRIADGWERALVYIYNYKKPFSFEAARGKPPRDPYRREIYYVPLVTPAGKVINERTGRMDFKDRGYTDKKVMKGSKVATIEYIPGEVGIRVTGEVIPFKDIPPLPFQVDEETLEVKKTKSGDKIIYDIIAKMDGYLYVEGGLIGLSEFVKEKKVDYTTGNIVFEGTGVNIEVAVEGDRAIHDAVKDDFKLISPGKTVVVKGNVGRKAVVEGRFVVIEGMVAKDALIKGEVCKVNGITGGKIEADRCFVDRAINAQIEAKEAFAYTLSGAVVKAERIVALKTLRSSILYAYDFICVEEARDFNKFILEPKEVPSIAAKIGELEARKRDLEKRTRVVEGAAKKLDGRIDAQINLLISYMRPVMKENAVKLRPLVRSLLKDPDKLKSVSGKFPPYAKGVVDEIVRLHEGFRQRCEEAEGIKKEIQQVTGEIEEIVNREGVVLVFQELFQDNMVVIRGAKGYFNNTLKGPVLFVKEGGKLSRITDWDEIVKRLSEMFDKEYLELFRDYLLEKGLRSYVTKMKL